MALVGTSGGTVASARARRPAMSSAWTTHGVGDGATMLSTSAHGVDGLAISSEKDDEEVAKGVSLYYMAST